VSSVASSLRLARVLRASLWKLALLAALPAAFAQNTGAPRNAPHLAYAYPPGATRGTTVTLLLGGQYLAENAQLHCSDSHLSARVVSLERPLTQKEAVELREQAEQLRQRRRDAPATFTDADAQKLTQLQDTLARRNPNPKTPALAETLTVELTVPPDAPAGARELRVATRAGLSNPVAFIVGTLPEITPPAATATSAPARKSAAPAERSRPVEVQLPAVVNGQLLPGEIDTLRFTGRRGQQLTVALAARSLMPYLADAVPGWIQAVIHLRDPQGHEIAFNDDFQFRPDPALGCALPADGTYELEIHDALYRGREDFVYRVTLGELPFIRSVFPLGAPLAQPTTVALSGWNLPAPTVAVDAAAQPPGIMLLSVQKAGHRSNSLRFALGAHPELTEPATGPALTLTLPSVVNGRIARPDERDTYHFTGRAGQSIVAEVFARRLDSPLDSRLELRGPDGQLLVANDDTEDKAEGLLTHHADSRVACDLPTTGDYTLTLTDTQHRGGTDYGYRLILRPRAPDFALRVAPSAVNLPAGGSALVTVFALRRDGFTGPIDLALESPGPGSGLHLDGARIPAGVESLQLTLTAASDRPPGAPFSLRLIGRAELAGHPLRHAATACDDTMQAFLYRHLVPTTQWLAQVTPRTVGFSPVTAAPVLLVPGAVAHVQLELAPGTPTFEQFQAELVNPPPGLTLTKTQLRGRLLDLTLAVAPGPAPAGQSAGNLVFSVSGARATRGPGEAKLRPLGLTRAVPYEFAAPR
jgi:hypothetical protein